MATTYYKTDLTKDQIDQALHAINGVASSQNNGKVLYIDENGEIKAKSAAEWTTHAVLQPGSASENGDFLPPSGVDGFSSFHVDVPNTYAASDEGKVVSNGALVAQGSDTVTQNGTVDTTLISSLTVSVSGGGSAVVQPLSVTQNGTYTPPSGVDGYAPVTVNVSGGGGSVVRVSTRSMGGSDASVDVYADELFVENVGFVSVLAGAYKDFGIIRVMYNTPASASPDGVAHTGWCVFALSNCTANGSTYTANQLILEWPYNRAQTCVAVS